MLSSKNSTTIKLIPQLSVAALIKARQPSVFLISPQPYNRLHRSLAALVLSEVDNRVARLGLTKEYPPSYYHVLREDRLLKLIAELTSKVESMERQIVGTT